MRSKPSYLLFSLALFCGTAQLFVAGCGKKSGPEVPRTDSVGLLSRSAVHKMKGSRLCKGNKKGENDSSLFRNEITVVSDSHIQFWPGDVILTVYHYDSASQGLLYQYLPPEPAGTRGESYDLSFSFKDNSIWYSHTIYSSMDIWKFSCHAPAHKYLAELRTYTHKIAGKRNWTGDHICHACAQYYHDSVTSFKDVFELIYVNDSTLVKTCHYYGRSGIWDTLHFNSWDADANKITYTRMDTCDASVTYDYSTEAFEFVDHYYNPPHDTEIYYVLKAQ